MNPLLKRWLTEAFTENLYYKVLSAGLVLLLYVWVLGDRQGEVSFFAPIRVVVPEDRVLTSGAVDQVRVTVRGNVSRLRQLSTQAIDPLLIDLESKELEDVVRFDKEMFSLGGGTSVVSIQPSFMRVSMARRETRKVAVRARLVGEPPPGYSVTRVQTKPTRLTLSGPAEAVARARVALTEPIDVSERTESFEENVELRHDSSFVRDDLREPVSVSVTIEQREIERVVRELPVRVINTSSKAVVSPATVDVTLRGPKDLLDRVSRDALFASVDLGDVSSESSGTYQRSARIGNVPDSIKVARFYPTEFRVTLTPETTP